MDSLLTPASHPDMIELPPGEREAIAAGRAAHEAMERALRAKPLNAHTRAALPVGIKVWDDQIAYLTEALNENARTGYKLTPKIRMLFEEQRRALIRSREWLASKITES